MINFNDEFNFNHSVSGQSTFYQVELEVPTEIQCWISKSNVDLKL